MGITYKINSYRLLLEAISPITIGSGEILDKKLDAIENNGVVYIVDINKLIKIASERNKLHVLDNFTNIQSVLQMLEVTDMELVARYKMFGSIVNKSSNVNVNRINTIIKLVDNRPYIPGSEIKGSIRTAILYYHCKKDPNTLREALNKLNKFTKINRKTAARELEDKVFRASSRDMHYDMLRYLLFSDTCPLDGYIHLGEILLISTKQRPRPLSLVEYINPGSRFNGRMDLRMIHDGKSIDKSTSQPSLRFILDACNEFSHAIVKYEMNKINGLKQNTRYSEMTSIYDQLTNFYKELDSMLSSKKDDSAIIRLGYGEGHFSTTIGLLLYEYKEQYRKLFSRLKIKEPISRRVVRDAKGNIMPFGWARIVLQEKERGITSYSD
ncbi:MAG: type III-A CRISPR-associated RAMP protein Csm5 [Candidatus Nitrosocaldus sp.]